MSKKIKFVLLGTLAVLCVLGGISATPAASQEFQKTPIVLLASEVIPRSLLVGYLTNMAGSGVENCRVYIGTAAEAMEESVAVFLRVRAQLMGLYNEKEKSVASFVDAHGIPMLLTRSGVIVGIFPLDHVAWTAGVAQKLMAVSSALKGMQGVTGKELWITGTVDPVARKVLENNDWKVQDKY